MNATQLQALLTAQSQFDAAAAKLAQAEKDFNFHARKVGRERAAVLATHANLAKTFEAAGQKDAAPRLNDAVSAPAPVELAETAVLAADPAPAPGGTTAPAAEPAKTTAVVKK